MPRCNNDLKERFLRVIDPSSAFFAFGPMLALRVQRSGLPAMAAKPSPQPQIGFFHEGIYDAGLAFGVELSLFLLMQLTVTVELAVLLRHAWPGTSFA